MHVARQFPAVGVIGQVVYVVGGANGKGVLSSVEKYSLQEDAWTLAQAIAPTTACGTGVVPQSGKSPILFAVGGLQVFQGCADPADPCKPVRAVSKNVFGKLNKRGSPRGWVAGSPLATGRVYHGVAALDTPDGWALLAIGGSTNYDASNYTHALASVERLVVGGDDIGSS